MNTLTQSQKLEIFTENNPLFKGEVSELELESFINDYLSNDGYDIDLAIERMINKTGKLISVYGFDALKSNLEKEVLENRSARLFVRNYKFNNELNINDFQFSISDIDYMLILVKSIINQLSNKKDKNLMKVINIIKKGVKTEMKNENNTEHQIYLAKNIYYTLQIHFN